VGSTAFWVGLAALAGLTFFATLALALRLTSRSRVAEQFERRGKASSFERFVVVRSQFILTAALPRAAAKVVLFVAILWLFQLFESDLNLTRLAIACAVTWSLVVVFGIAIPQAWALYAGDWVVVRAMPLLLILRFVFYPFVWLALLLDPLVRRLAGVPARDEQSFADEFEKEILDVVSEGERHGAVDEAEREMIESVIELADTRVEEIMTPRTDMIALSKTASLEDVLETVRTNGHSRIPVYDDTIDHVLGVLYAKDILRRNQDELFDMTEMMRPALFVPESKLVRELLNEFQARKVHIAIVLDEYGGTAGLLTIEDILEELVGDIADEYEPEEPDELKRIDDNTVEVDARMRIDELNDELKIEVPEDEDYETIGGFVFSTLGHIPRVGEKCQHQNVGIQVIDAEPRRVKRLRLTITPAERNGEPES